MCHISVLFKTYLISAVLESIWLNQSSFKTVEIMFLITFSLVML